MVDGETDNFSHILFDFIIFMIEDHQPSLSEEDEIVIALLDPDFLFLSPLEFF